MPAEKAIKLGNPGKRPRKSLAAAARPDQPAPPEINAPPCPLTLGPAGRLIWAALFDYLDRRQQLKYGDHHALARLCKMYEEQDLLYAACRNRRGAFSPTYRTKTTTGATKIVVRPEYRLANEMKPAILALEREFGLTPSSRAAVVQKLAEARDPERPQTTPGAAARRPDAAAQPDAPPPLAVGGLAPARKLN